MPTMLKRILHISVLIFALAASAAAQNPYLQGSLSGGTGVPGTKTRSALNTIERAAGSLAGVTILTDTFGNQRLALYVHIEDTCINYTPAATGNTNNLSAFVEKCSTDSVWYIDFEGKSQFIGAAGSACDADWLEITSNSCPDNINDSIYTQKYAAVGARLVWPTAELLVSDSTGVQVTVLSGNRNSRLGFWDNVNQFGSTIDQSGAQTLWYIEPTGEMRWATAGSGTVQAPGAPFINQFAINPPDSTIQAHLYPRTRIDTASVHNFLYTDNLGKFRSQPIDSLIQIIYDSLLIDTALAVNWYTTNGTTTDLGRTALVKRTAIWLGVDTVGFLRHQVGLLDGSRITTFQDSAVIMRFGSNYTNYVTVGDSSINIATSGPNPQAVNIRTDTINFYDNYYWAQGPPSFTVGDTSFHFWAGNGIGTNPGFMLLDDIRGDDINIYRDDGLLKSGGTTVGLDSGSLKFNLRTTAAATVYGIEMLGNTATASNRFISFRTEVDSMRFQEFGGEYYMISTVNFQNNISDQFRNLADSVQWIEGTVQSETGIRYLYGSTPTGWMKRFDGGGSAGDVIVSDGDVWRLSTATAAGYVLQNGNSFGAAMVIGTNDNNSLSFETNTVTRATVTAGATTGGQWTMTNVTANTATISDILTLQTNSTGTAAANFGSAILFQGESSTTDNRDMVRLSAIWTTATDASRASALVYSDVTAAGALTERFRFLPTSMRLNTTYTFDGNGNGITVGNSSGAVTVGGNTGVVQITSSGTGSSSVILLNTSGNNTNTSGTFGGATFSTTTGTKYDWRMSSNFNPTSGTGLFYNLFFNGTINQTGGANGDVGAIAFAPTLTAVGSSWSALTMTTSNSSAKFLNQTGANTTSTHVGAFGIGSTTVPTDKLEVTGNVALLTAGNKLKIATGSNASVGTSAAMTAGSITISTTAVTASSQIFLTHASVGGTQGILSVGAVTAGTSFVINSSNAADTGTVNWLIIN